MKNYLCFTFYLNVQNINQKQIVLSSIIIVKYKKKILKPKKKKNEKD